MSDTYDSKFHASGFNDVASYTPDKLMERDYKAEKVTIASGAGALARGTLMGVITASGKYIKSLSAASDGSQTPKTILAYAVDATSADAEGIVFYKGTFNQNALVLGAGHTLASIKDGLRLRDIELSNDL